EPQTPDFLRRLRDRFDMVVDLAPAARSRMIAELEGTDPVLAAELATLLAAHDSTGEHLVTLVSSGTLRQALALDEPWRGRRVGPYEVGARIGIGGMGDVYHATRADQEFSKHVAIKF